METLVSVHKNVSQVNDPFTTGNPTKSPNVSQYNSDFEYDQYVTAKQYADEAKESAEAAAESAEEAATSENNAAESALGAANTAAEVTQHVANAIIAEQAAAISAEQAKLAASYAEASEDLAKGYVEAAKVEADKSRASAIQSEASASSSKSYSVLSENSSVASASSAGASKISQDASKVSELASKESEIAAAVSAQHAEDIYNSMLGGLVHRGGWNPQAEQAYPTNTDTNAIWIVFLNEGFDRYEWNGVEWKPGDQLLYDKTANQFYHIGTPLGVLSVNSKTGDVVLVASDVKARPDDWIPSITEVTGILDFGRID